MPNQEKKISHVKLLIRKMEPTTANINVIMKERYPSIFSS